jgi:hypothetical protein
MSYQNQDEECDGWLDVPLEGDTVDVPSWSGHGAAWISDGALSVAPELGPDCSWEDADSAEPARCYGWDDDQDDTTDEDEDADDFFPDDEDEDFDDDEDDDYDDEDDLNE